MGLLEGIHQVADVIGIGEVASLMGTAGKAGLTEGAEKFMGPIGTALSLIDCGKGGYEAAEAIDKGDAQEGMEATHDLLGGTAGMLGNVPGPVGAVAKSFGAGMAVGDLIAPVIFGSEEEDNKPHMEDIPEDGKFKPSCGNQYIDSALDFFGVRD